MNTTIDGHITKLSIPNTDNKTCILRFSKTHFTLIDEQFIDKVSKLAWYPCNKYVIHKVKEDNAYGFEKNYVYLHEFILKYCVNQDKPDNCNSVDHINGCKLDNRQENLRYATQSMQNFNRGACTHKTPPPQELRDIGIHEFPKYIRYCNDDTRFELEKHPQMLKNNIKQLHGTRKKEPMVQKYYAFLQKAISMYEEDLDTYKELPGQTTNPEYAIINKHIGSDVFKNRPVTPDYHQSYLQHVKFIEDKYTIISNYTNIPDEKENTVVFNGEFVYKDDKFELLKSDVPEHVTFIGESKTRGSKFSYDFRDKSGKRTLLSSSGSKKMSVKNKLDEIKLKLATAELGEMMK
jgi:hypothetical protein